MSDYFTFLGLSRKLGVDKQDLDRRYRALSRQFHPDYFHNASPAERRLSLERSAYLNDAYRTLKDPVSRVQYLLTLEGEALLPDGASPQAKQAPAALLEEVFALNEELDEVRRMRGAGAAPAEWQARLERARRPIEAKRSAHEAQIAALTSDWDAAMDEDAPIDRRRAILAALGARFLERNYVSNLLAGIERELGG